MVKGRSLLLDWSHIRSIWVGSGLAVEVTSTLACHDVELITIVKCFKVQALAVFKLSLIQIFKKRAKAQNDFSLILKQEKLLKEIVTFIQ